LLLSGFKLRFRVVRNAAALASGRHSALSTQSLPRSSYTLDSLSASLDPTLEMSELRNGDTVPQELIDYIVDLLFLQYTLPADHSDLKEAFSSYTLISRAWVPQCRIYLHRDLRFIRDGDELPKADGYDDPHVARHVSRFFIAISIGKAGSRDPVGRNATAAFATEKDQIIWTIFARLPNIASIDLYSHGFSTHILDYVYYIGENKIQDLSHRFRLLPYLTHLELFGIAFCNLHMLVSFLRSVDRLESLTLTDVYTLKPLDPSAVDVETLVQAFAHLHTISFEASRARKAIKPFMRDFSSLLSVAYVNGSLMKLRSLGWNLDANGRFLTKLLI